MRIDMLLNKLCLVKTRSIAKKACDSHLVLRNGKPAKASDMVVAGDTIDYSLAGYRTVLRMKEIPAGNVAKKDAATCYELLSREKMDLPDA